MKQTVTLLSRVLAATGLTFVTHFVMFVVCWIFRDPLFRLMDRAIYEAVGAESASAAGAAGPLLSVAFFAALLLSSPFVIALWSFILFGWPARRDQIRLILFFMALAGCGVAIGYFIAFPLAVGLTGWAEARGLLSGEPLLDLLLRTVVGLAIVFQVLAATLALRIWGPSEGAGHQRIGL